MIDRARYKSRSLKLTTQMRTVILISSVLLTFAKENDSKNRMSLDLRHSFKEHGEMKRGLGFLENPFLQNSKFEREPIRNDNQVHVTRIKCS